MHTGGFVLPDLLLLLERQLIRILLLVKPQSDQPATSNRQATADMHATTACIGGVRSRRANRNSWNKNEVKSAHPPNRTVQTSPTMKRTCENTHKSDLSAKGHMHGHGVSPSIPPGWRTRISCCTKRPITSRQEQPWTSLTVQASIIHICSIRMPSLQPARLGGRPAASTFEKTVPTCK